MKSGLCDGRFVVGDMLAGDVLGGIDGSRVGFLDTEGAIDTVGIVVGCMDG